MTTYLPLGPAEVFKGAQIRAHRDVSVRLLQQTMAKLASAGARAAQLEQHRASSGQDVLSEPGPGRALSERLRASYDDTPTYTNTHDLEKEAARQLLQRAGKALKKWFGKKRPPVSKPAGRGPFRTQPPETVGRGLKPSPKVSEQLSEVRRSGVSSKAPKDGGGYLRSFAKGVIPAAAIGGGAYALAKAGPKAIDTLQQAKARPMRPNVTGYQQHRFGFGTRQMY